LRKTRLNLSPRINSVSPPPFTGNNPLTPGPSASRRARGEYSVSPSFFTSISTKGRTENPLLISLSLGEVPEGRVRGILCG
jgi:hypothetical protein